MRVFIQKDPFTKEFVNPNCFTAFYGFQKMGWEIETYEITPPEGLGREDIVVGYISSVKKGLKNLGITPPSEIDYPKELQDYYGRKLWTTILSDVANNPDMYPVFIKPVSGKQFDGRLVTGFKDLIGCGNPDDDPEIWCSEPVNFVAEYRCFIRYGQVIDVRRYKGSWIYLPNAYVIKSCLEDFKNVPAGCSLDFGVTGDGRTLLIEVNDGYALGCYGLMFHEYAKLISARWAEMTDTMDHCRF